MKPIKQIIFFLIINFGGLAIKRHGRRQAGFLVQHGLL